MIPLLSIGTIKVFSSESLEGYDEDHTYCSRDRELDGKSKAIEPKKISPSNPPGKKQNRRNLIIAILLEEAEPKFDPKV